MTRSVFLTGATGFLGQHVFEQLRAQDWQITVLCRQPQALRTRYGASELSRVNICQGDITTPASVRAAMPEAVDAVVHLAANTSMWFKNNNQQWQDNVEGTRTLAQVALEKKAAKFVYISSVAAYGYRDDVIDEDSVQLGAQAPIPYYRSKAQAEQELRTYIAQGLNACIINPGHIIGPYDAHNWSRLLRLLAQGRLPGIPPGAGSFCYAPEVARAIIRAIDFGRSGENYLLAGCDASFAEVVTCASHLLAQEFGVAMSAQRRPKPLPAWLLKCVGRAHDGLSLVTGREPELSYYAALVACSHARINSVKAATELGFRRTELNDMLRPTLSWLKQQGLLDRR